MDDLDLVEANVSTVLLDGVNLMSLQFKVYDAVVDCVERTTAGIAPGQTARGTLAHQLARGVVERLEDGGVLDLTTYYHNLCGSYSASRNPDMSGGTGFKELALVAIQESIMEVENVTQRCLWVRLEEYVSVIDDIYDSLLLQRLVYAPGALGEEE